MEVIKKDELPSPYKCRCCLQEGELKELWTEYVLHDGVIVYGQQLVECFSLALHQPADVVEKICITCISKLQDASMFKKLVMESDKKMLENYLQDEAIKIEDDAECSEEINDCSKNENSDDDDNQMNPEYLEMEVLEAAGSNDPINTIDPSHPKTRRGINYRQYSPEDLNKCVNAVRLEVMSRVEAAKFFNVPYKTLESRLKVDDTTKEDIIAKNNLLKEKYKAFLQEIKTVFKYTNVTPYKSKTGNYFCAYCRAPMDDSDILRTHTRTVHAAERFSGVDVFMKANWLNEIIKVDIADLQCIICPAPIDTWNDMFAHLKNKHRVELNEAYTKVIPYNLNVPLMCALCGDSCDTYTILDAHMNFHYSNYICGDCGDTFIAEARLKKHSEIHSTQKYECPFCPKFFALERYRKKHVDGVHREGLVYRCRYCKEVFVNEYRRHQHMEEHHPEQIKTITCKICEKTFTFRPYYLKHMRLTHKKKDAKRYKCGKCDKLFGTRYEARKHEEWHLGRNKQTCLVCNKTFASKQYLEKHYEKAHDDTDLLVLETEHIY